MSLINDALKEAKQAQQQAPPPPALDLQLRPIEPGQYTRQTGGVMLPAALLVIALLLLVIVWQHAHPSGAARPLEVQARTARATMPSATPRAAPTSVAPAPAAQTVAEAAPAPAAAPKAGPASPGEIAAAPLTLDPQRSTPSDEGMTNTAAAPEVAPPKPAPSKLQAIFFSPPRPSVMISGQTLFVGDTLEGWRVAAIDRESVTLVSAGQTNVLSLAK